MIEVYLRLVGGHQVINQGASLEHQLFGVPSAGQVDLETVFMVDLEDVKDIVTKLVMSETLRKDEDTAISFNLYLGETELEDNVSIRG